MLFSIFDTCICYIQILGYLVEYPCKYLARLWKWQLSLLASQLVSTLTSSKKKCHCPVSKSSVENALYTRSGKRSSSIIGQTRRPRRHGLTHTLHFVCFSLKIECENLQKKRPKMQKVRPPNLTVFCTVSLSVPIQSFCIVYRMFGLMQTHGVRVSKCITKHGVPA